MDNKTVLTIKLCSVWKQVDVPLEKRDYTFEEVRELLPAFAITVDSECMDILRKLRNKIQSLEADLEMANDRIKFLEENKDEQ